MLTETNTLSLHMMHMSSWFVGPVISKEMVASTIVVVDVVNQGVAIVAVEIMELCYYNNNRIITNTIVRWCQVETEKQLTLNVMDFRNGGILLSISQITTAIINAKFKVVVKMSQSCFKLMMVLKKMKIRKISLALGSYQILVPLWV